eukprot:TRINITY_DN4756_c0_g1_i1.p1 TRINITY_DN4756_c0_g1~~TRINITY_DN4756_c0_g1_i1.p1  ORF type:complete len:171 (-),score=35.19 TRINITY_DN4756_c0_g1_i1:47-559(-)
MHSDGTRETRGEDGVLIERIRKQRLRDLNIALPAARFDLRLSASREEHLPEPSSAKIQHEREKERRSYIFGEMYSVDLTRVVTRNGGRDSVTFELEIELVGKTMLLAQADLARASQPSQLASIAQGLLHNARAFCWLRVGRAVAQREALSSAAPARHDSRKRTADEAQLD